ncbi:MAG: F0F1 ATP synthase subunit A [Patescibacteria group bacterium]|nr:F0F1 ATP synthase subunit A [Patescibacteria group bacterium]
MVSPSISIKAEEIFQAGGFALSNSFLLLIIVCCLLAVLALVFKKQFTLIPEKFQAIVEIGVEKMLGLMDSCLGSRVQSEKYLPFIITIFVFILFANLAGLFPGVGSIGWKHGDEFKPFLRAPTADINFTLALALISVILTNIFAFREIGFSHHAAKFVNFKGPIQFFVGILELISELSRVVSFTFRLFGNIFAGEVLLLIVSVLLPLAGPIPFFFLEIFVGFIQAFVFAMLTLVFLGLHLQHGTLEENHQFNKVEKLKIKN